MSESESLLLNIRRHHHHHQWIVGCNKLFLSDEINKLKLNKLTKTQVRVWFQYAIHLRDCKEAAVMIVGQLINHYRKCIESEKINIGYGWSVSYSAAAVSTEADVAILQLFVDKAIPVIIFNPDYSAMMTATPTILASANLTSTTSTDSTVAIKRDRQDERS